MERDQSRAFDTSVSPFDMRFLCTNVRTYEQDRKRYGTLPTAASLHPAVVTTSVCNNTRVSGTTPRHPQDRAARSLCDDVLISSIHVPNSVPASFHSRAIPTQRRLGYRRVLALLARWSMVQTRILGTSYTILERCVPL